MPPDAGLQLSYCTNVHAGATLAETLANLERYALGVKSRFVPGGGPMGVGLWLSAEAAQQLIAEDKVPDLQHWLADRGLMVASLNGFPYGDFHEPVVKHRVYEPDWSDPRRLAYTRNLARILAGLMPEGASGSISTLPIGWREALRRKPGAVEAAAEQLMDLVHFLARLELDTGRLVHIDLEPEPGCYLNRSADVVAFFQKHLLGTSDDLSVRSYLGVCHDVCHAAVMFEDQAAALAAYRAAGIMVGKVQISSAVRVVWDDLSEQERGEAFAQLRALDEPRYLHQTVVRPPEPLPSAPEFFEDLPVALASTPANGNPGAGVKGEWRVHFHVPVYLDRFGLLQTTREQIGECLRALRPEDSVRHFEVETYAWEVLPAELRVPDLAEGIAREMIWVRDNAAAGKTAHAD